MNSFILRRAVHFLEGSDAFSASCVCQEWNRSLLDADQADYAELWKQVCSNTNPNSTKAVLEAEQPNVDFRSLCISLERGMEAAEPTQFTPSVDFEEDVFAIIELYRRTQVGGKRRRAVVASWNCHHPVGHEEESLQLEIIPERRAVLIGNNRYHASPPSRPSNVGPGLPYQRFCNREASRSAARNAVGMDGVPARSNVLRVKVTLFRRDNMKSVCIMDEQVDGVTEGRAEAPPSDSLAYFCFLSGRKLPFDSNEAGHCAAHMMFDRGIEGFYLDGEMKVSFCNQDDQRAASAMPRIDFEVSSFFFGFKTVPLNEHTYERRFGSLDDLSVAVAGLRWR